MKLIILIISRCGRHPIQHEVIILIISRCGRHHIQHEVNYFDYHSRCGRHHIQHEVNYFMDFLVKHSIIGSYYTLYCLNIFGIKLQPIIEKT